MRSVKTPTKAEVLEFPISGDVVTAGRFFGLGRDATYRAVKDGTFPVPVLKIGGRLRVTRSAVLAALGIEDDQ
jgi:hypothetical protein